MKTAKKNLQPHLSDSSPRTARRRSASLIAAFSSLLLVCSPYAIASSPSLALSPAVIMVNAQAGQSTAQKLTISNLTPTEFEFTLEAMDVVVREGKRVFVPAGEMPGSIARTAVFSPPTVSVAAGSSSTVTVTLTIPEPPANRAIVAIFHSKTVMQGRGGVGMTASVGTLLTFTLSKEFKIESSGIHIDGASEGDELVISEWITNSGAEPVVVQGVVAVLKAREISWARSLWNLCGCFRGSDCSLKLTIRRCLSAASTGL
jgi:hypothetical protein